MGCDLCPNWYHKMYIKNMEQHASPWYSDSRFAPFWRQYNALMSAAHQDAICKAEHVANQARAALMSSLISGQRPHIQELYLIELYQPP
ncbi:hypothetical protein E2C01_017502 [Portunus trituberculatus]|uniref:Uncharacterized protein n=1 Tax=Portunus trituberculatus TaxID=210409 RepID=A0A5B7DS11_PORTR|nr:hypothetical protein [Portunus trituberculatus]